MRSAPMLFAIPVLLLALALVSLRASLHATAEIPTIQLTDNVFAVNVQH
ncbi:MAG: hypothetical protein ACJATT_002643 [Myxococcota bacterium]